MRRIPAVILVAFGVLCACKSRAKPDAGPSAAERKRERDALVQAIAKLDFRREPFGKEWKGFARSSYPAVRERLALALGRGVDPRAIPLLARLLADEAPKVRAAAAFALGCYEGRSTRPLLVALRERLRHETDPKVVSAILIALGRAGRHNARLVLAKALGHPIASVREAAALACGRLAANRRAVPRRLVISLRYQLRKEKDPKVWRAIAFALSRLGAAVPELLSSRDAMTRYYAVSAWARAPRAKVAPIVPLLKDSDWRVQVAALSTVAAKGTEALAAVEETAKRTWDLFVSAPGYLRGKQVQLVLASVSALRRLLPRSRAALERIYRQATEKLRGASKEARTSLNAVHCEAAFALDVSDGKPERVRACGRLTAPFVQKRLAAKVLDATRKTSRAQRLALLKPLLKELDPRARTAAADAFAKVWGVKGSREILFGALKTRDVGVLSSLFDMIGARGGRDPELEQAVLSAAKGLRPGQDVEARISLARALRQVGSPKSAPVLRDLALKGVEAVRREARVSYVRLYPSDPPLPPGERRLSGFPRPIETASKALVAKVDTTKGSFSLRLLTNEAPLTVGNFLELVRKRFYDGNRIHRLVPAFVVQMGDPRGDGTGGPGYSLPCELTPRRYRRGSVGMALAGRDTGGSQFFITHRETPHLDGAYTLFGEVTEGMDIVESLVEGDRILRISLR